MDGVVELLPITKSDFSRLKKDYLAVASAGISAYVPGTPKEISCLVEEQLSPLVEQAQSADNEYFRNIVEQGTNEVVGTLWYRLHPDTHFSDMALVVWLGIYPRFRRRGFGSLALRTLGTELKSQGIQRLTLEVFNKNKSALKLYKSLNFEPERTVMGLSI